VNSILNIQTGSHFIVMERGGGLGVVGGGLGGGWPIKKRGHGPAGELSTLSMAGNTVAGNFKFKPFIFQALLLKGITLFTMKPPHSTAPNGSFTASRLYFFTHIITPEKELLDPWGP
jgi:hypothetical protein